MKFPHAKPTLLIYLITLVITAMVTADQPGQGTNPEAGKTTVTHPEHKAFPAAKAGMERFGIVLPHKERGEEDAFRVELIAGKIMETDGINLVRLGSSLKEKPLEGWGYTFYEVHDGPAMSTRIGADPKAPPVNQFVSGQPLHIMYNSRLPIVVYAPAGYEIRYRIWRADEKFSPAGKS